MIREKTVAALLAWATEKLKHGPALIYASAPPDKVAAVQARFGRDKAGEMIEHAIASLASGLAARGRAALRDRRRRDLGCRRLGTRRWRRSRSDRRSRPAFRPACPMAAPRYALALKSGNFGGPDFFAEALEALA